MEVTFIESNIYDQENKFEMPSAVFVQPRTAFS